MKNTIDQTTLAEIAARLPEASLYPKAAAEAALALWHECGRTLKNSARWEEFDKTRKEYATKEWPKPFDEGLRLLGFRGDAEARETAFLALLEGTTSNAAKVLKKLKTDGFESLALAFYREARAKAISASKATRAKAQHKAKKRKKPTG